MKLTILAESFKTALGVARAGADEKTRVVPILGDVLLEADPDGGLTITGTDLRVRAWATTSARVEEPGRACLPARTLWDVLQQGCADDDAVTLVVDERQKAQLSAGRSRVKLSGHDPDDFPAAPEPADGPSVLVPGAVFGRLVSSTARAAATVDNREVLEGVHLALLDRMLTAEAADGFRFARRTTSIEDAEGVSFDGLVPAQALRRAMRVISGQDEPVTLAVDDDACWLSSAGGRFRLPLIDGQFPNVDRVMPKDTSRAVVVEREPLLRALRLGMSFIYETRGDDGRTTKTAIARLAIESDLLTLTATDSSHDHESVSEIACALAGEPIRVGVNGRYLRDALESLEGAEVRLSLDAVTKPIRIEAVDDPDELHVIMPMHTAKGS